MRAPIIFTANSRDSTWHRAFGALMALLVLASTGTAEGMSRIKDVADFEGVRANQLVGYGLTVGLNGSGDRLTNSPFTRQSLIGMLERLGVNVRGLKLNTRNVAAVMVTATLPPFARQGSRLDVTVSSLGDAKSLLGGTLLVTPLMGADGEVYAVAQGQLAVGGFTASGASGSSITRGVPTSARIPNGALIERESGFEIGALSEINISLRNPDFTTASRIAQAINARIGEPAARATDPGTVHVEVPERYRTQVAMLLTEIEQLLIEPDQPAKVVIDERSGVIVIGEKVRISTVAETIVVERTDIEVDEDSDKRIAVLSPGVSLHELIEGLNALGVGPRDIITILQAIKAAGALQAEIEML